MTKASRPLLRPFHFTVEVDIMACNYSKAVMRFNKLMDKLNTYDKDYNTYIRIVDNFVTEDCEKSKEGR